MDNAASTYIDRMIMIMSKKLNLELFFNGVFDVIILNEYYFTFYMLVPLKTVIYKKKAVKPFFVICLGLWNKIFILLNSLKNN